MEGSNDDHGTDAAGSLRDPHGEAALLLIESVIHALIAKSLLSLEDAIEIVARAGDAKAEALEDMGMGSASARRSLDLISKLAESLRQDLLTV